VIKGAIGFRQSGYISRIRCMNHGMLLL
jgi:hypothetical protein